MEQGVDHVLSRLILGENDCQIGMPATPEKCSAPVPEFGIAR